MELWFSLYPGVDTRERPSQNGLFVPTVGFFVSVFFVPVFFMNKFYTKFLDVTMTECELSFDHFVELFNDECSFTKDF